MHISTFVVLHPSIPDHVSPPRRPTLASAEQCARQIVAERGGVAVIERLTTRRDTYLRDEVANVRTDPFGRLWCDLMGEGATLL